MKRRHVLRRAAGALALTAGCLSGTEPATDATTSTVRTTTRDTTTATTTKTTTTYSGPADPRETVETLPQEPPEGDVDCGDESLYEVNLGADGSHPQRTDGFELEASKDSVAIGEDVTFELTHTGSEVRTIGEIYKYNVQYRDGGEWQHVYVTPEPLWTALGIVVAEGAGYRWPFTFDREGLERQNGHGNPPYHVCSPLQPGEYRFLFDGLPDDGTVAVRFAVEDG